MGVAETRGPIGVLSVLQVPNRQEPELQPWVLHVGSERNDSTITSCFFADVLCNLRT